MSNEEKIELDKGSGNVFRDFRIPNAEAEQLRPILAAQIIQALDERQLTVRQAENLTGIAAADFSRIRHANLGHFTIDRLITILGRLNRQIEITVRVRSLASELYHPGVPA